MALYGYARVSILDQNRGIQPDALKAGGCDVIRAEKASGTRRDGRTELQVLLDFLRPGDALVVTRIDRLARSLRDLQLKERRVTLRATEQPIDTGTAAGKAFLDMLGVFAEFETNLRKAGADDPLRLGQGRNMNGVAVGMSAATNGTPVSISPEMRWTLRASRSSLAISKVAR